MIPVDECQALADIYLSTSGDSWTNDTNRFRTLSPEEWFGVRLGTYGSGLHVDGLFLHKSTGSDTYGPSNLRNGNNLVGELPNVFAELPYLKDLNLTNNALRGEIPDSLGSTLDLEQLRLSENNLSGELPATLGNLTSLRVLRVSENGLVGTIPSALGQLTALE